MSVLFFVRLNGFKGHPVFDLFIDILKSLQILLSVIMKNKYSLRTISTYLDLCMDFCYSYLEILLVLFVMFSRLLLCLLSLIDVSGLKQSVWRSSEKEKLENLLDISIGEMENNTKNKNLDLEW